MRMRINCDVFAHNNDEKNIKMNLMNEKKIKNRILNVKMIIDFFVSLSVPHKIMNCRFSLLLIYYRS